MEEIILNILLIYNILRLVEMVGGFIWVALQQIANPQAVQTQWIHGCIFVHFLEAGGSVLVLAQTDVDSCLVEVCAGYVPAGVGRII